MFNIVDTQSFDRKSKGKTDRVIPPLATPPKFNIAPEKWWLEDYFPIGKITFQGLC